MKTTTHRVTLFTASLFVGAALADPVERRVYATDYDGMTPVQQLTNAVAQAQNGDTITIARGTYVFPDDVYMADNTRDPSSPCYCKIRLSLKAKDVTIQGEDATGWRTWTNGAEPVVIDGNGGKGLQVQIAKADGVTIRNLTFANCNGGASGSDSLYGNWCNGGAIGLGKMENPWEGGSATVVTNCVFRHNTAALGSCVGSKNHFNIRDCFCTNNLTACFYYGNVRDSDLVGNYAVGNGMSELRHCRVWKNEGNDSAGICNAGTVTDCTFIENKVPNAWSPIVAVSKLLLNCAFTNNYNSPYGAVTAGGKAVITNCTFHGGANGNQNCAAVTDAKEVVNCRFTCNGGYGGGGLNLKTAGYRCYVKDTYFGGNGCSAGGGGAGLCADLSKTTAADLAEPLLVFDHCTFETNVAYVGNHGGAINNRATNIPAGVDPRSLVVCSNGCQFIGTPNTTIHAHGVKYVTAIGCSFRDHYTDGFNYLGGDAAYSRLVDCDCAGGNFYYCSLDRCRIHDVKRGVFNRGCSVTNTLVTGCNFDAEYFGVVGTYSSATYSNGGDFNNCTFAANRGNFFGCIRYANDVTFRNCAFFANTNFSGTATALSADSASTTTMKSGDLADFSHCAYGPLASGAPVPQAEAGNFLSENPRFNAGRDPSRPAYEPRYNSPLRDAGADLGFTADDLDLAGRKRLNGPVDIGCYEGWSSPNGLAVGVQ